MTASVRTLPDGPRPSPAFDVDALYVALDRQRRAQRLSWRDMGRHIGVSSSTFSRMAYGDTPSVPALVAMLAWLGTTDLAPYVVARPSPTRPEET